MPIAFLVLEWCNLIVALLITGVRVTLTAVISGVRVVYVL